MEIKYEHNGILQEDLPAIHNLLQQLLSGEKDLSWEEIAKTMEHSMIFIARQDGIIIAMLTLTKVYKLMGFFGTIEDVITDEAYQRQGIATQLKEMAFIEAKKLGMKYIELTSNPAREKANAFYQKHGFERRDTNVYKITL